MKFELEYWLAGKKQSTESYVGTIKGCLRYAQNKLNASVIDVVDIYTTDSKSKKWIKEYAL